MNPHSVLEQLSQNNSLIDSLLTARLSFFFLSAGGKKSDPRTFALFFLVFSETNFDGGVCV